MAQYTNYPQRKSFSGSNGIAPNSYSLYKEKGDKYLYRPLYHTCTRSNRFQYYKNIGTIQLGNGEHTVTNTPSKLSDIPETAAD